MKFFFLLIVVLSGSVCAHEVQLLSQHVDIRKQNTTGMQHDLLARAELSRKFEAGLQGTYIERFSFYEKRGGGNLLWYPKDDILIEAKALFGKGENQILPHQDYFLNSYFAMKGGLSPFLFYRDTIYSTTHVQSFKLGLEIEKIPYLIFIPTVMGGKAIFSSRPDTKDIYNYGLKVIYYQERNFEVSVFGYKGKEASQGIIGSSSFLVDTTTGGASAAYYFVPFVKTELIFDYTDYHQLHNQFLTTTLNLAWRF